MSTSCPCCDAMQITVEASGADSLPLEYSEATFYACDCRKRVVCQRCTKCCNHCPCFKRKGKKT